MAPRLVLIFFWFPLEMKGSALSSLNFAVVSEISPWAVEGEVGLRDARLSFAAVLAPDPGERFAVSSGVLLGGDSHGIGGSTHTGLRVQAAREMAVTVEPGSAVIDTDHGPYVCTLDVAATLRLEPASRSQNRIDLIVARVYDDLHPDLCSPHGHRHFRLEVWTGDPSPTVPLRPEPLGHAWIPLAEVRVQADTTEVRDADITDLRGPGLATRGGVSVLYGADADPESGVYRLPGAYPGAQRWVHGEGRFPHQVWCGGGHGGWQAVHNALCHTASPAPGDWLWVRGGGALRELCSVTVRDPGVPYSIFPTGRAVLKQSPRTAVDVHTKVDDPNTGPAVNWSGTETPDGGDTRHVYAVPPVRFGPLTGDTRVYLTAQVIRTDNPEFGFAFRGDDIGENLLSVEVWPLPWI
ncbi:hypothetical protein ACH347_14750 [Saccharopolyspora sp. 5N102]|uniref:hypothetical protein n=1 Tax=Saccharopolyspora sp. 5N102 TaxID=3375155 RepID=UPI0037B189D0